MKVASAGLDPEYTLAKDLKDLAALSNQSSSADKAQGGRANGTEARFKKAKGVFISPSRHNRKICYGVLRSASLELEARRQFDSERAAKQATIQIFSRQDRQNCRGRRFANAQGL